MKDLLKALLTIARHNAFMAARKDALLRLITEAMGKAAVVGGEAPADDAIDEEDDVEVAVAS